MSNCPACKLPLLDGQAMNGLLKCHWDCTEETRKVLGEENADMLIQARTNARLLSDGIKPGSEMFKRLGGVL